MGLNALVNKNKSDFAAWSDINWVNPYNSSDFQIQRDNLLKKIEKTWGNTIKQGTEIQMEQFLEYWSQAIRKPSFELAKTFSHNKGQKRTVNKTNNMI